MLRFIAISALTLGLAACDDAPKTSEDTSVGTPAVSETTTVTDSQKVAIEYGAAMIKDGVAFGELYMGAPDAPITMIEYASLTCGHCAAFHTNVLPSIKENYIDTGKVRIVYRNFVMNQYDLAASMVARCVAPEQSFEMMGVLFKRQSQWMGNDPLAGLADIARKSGMNRAKFDTCLKNDALKRSLIDLQKMGVDDNVQGTPTFFINGTMHKNGPFEDFVKAFDDAL